MTRRQALAARLPARLPGNHVRLWSPSIDQASAGLQLELTLVHDLLKVVFVPREIATNLFESLPMKLQLLLSRMPILFGQAGASSADSSADTSSSTDAGENAITDKTGEIDFSATSVWETLDNMIDTVVDRLPFIVLGVIIFVIFFFLAGLARKLVRNFTKQKESANLGKVLGRIAQWALIFVGLIIAVAVISPSITPGRLLASLGVGGVAIGFAFKDILQNFMAGLLILMREPFKIGDQIISGDFEGTVEAIETRATMIKTYDGRRVVIPNSQIYTNPVVVNTAFDSKRSQYDIGIGYGDNLREAVKVVLNSMKHVDGVLSEPAPDVLVSELAGSTVNLRARWWTKPERASVVNISHEVIASIKEALDEAQIDMPFPTQMVLFHDQTEATDGDRTNQREGWPAGQSPPKPRTVAGAIGHFDNNNT